MPTTEQTTVTVPESPARTIIESTGEIVWSLQERLTRADVGLTEGNQEVVYSSFERAEPYQLSVTFSDGRTLATPIDHVVVRTDSSVDREPCKITVSHLPVPIVDAHVMLVDYVDGLGLDGEAITAWLEESKAIARGASGRRARVFEGDTIGNVTVEVQASTVRNSDRVILFVYLNWC